MFFNEPGPRHHKRHRKPISPKLLTYLAGLIAVITGVVLIKLDLARTEAGNPPQGEWATIGVMLIGFVIFCIAMSFKRPKKHRKGCCG